jgi:hypothetical protein
MKLKDTEGWNKSVEVNKDDDYGAEITRYSEAWADLMEAEIAQGKTVAQCADETGSQADNNGGITGFMYGCAVGILSKVWEHGEELRRWHNLKTQIGTEGEKANESGGVLNPALLCIGEKDVAQG